MFALGTRLGFDRELTGQIFDFLKGEDLVTAKALGGGIAITHNGIVAVEAARAPPKTPRQKCMCQLCQIERNARNVLSWYNSLPSKLIRASIGLVTGLSIFGLLFFVVAASINVSHTDTINLPLNQCGNELYNPSDVTNFFNNQMYFMWIPCLPIELGTYDADYKDYQLVISRVYYKKETDWSTKGLPKLSIPVFANGYTTIPVRTANSLSHVNQTFILTNTSTQNVAIPHAGGEVQIDRIWLNDGAKMLTLQFTHTITLKQYLSQFRLM